MDKLIKILYDMRVDIDELGGGRTDKKFKQKLEEAVAEIGKEESIKFDSYPDGGKKSVGEKNRQQSVARSRRTGVGDGKKISKLSG